MLLPALEASLARQGGHAIALRLTAAQFAALQAQPLSLDLVAQPQLHCGPLVLPLSLVTGPPAELVRVAGRTASSTPLTHAARVLPQVRGGVLKGRTSLDKDRRSLAYASSGHASSGTDERTPVQRVKKPIVVKTRLASPAPQPKRAAGPALDAGADRKKRKLLPTSAPTPGLSQAATPLTSPRSVAMGLGASGASVTNGSTTSERSLRHANAPPKKRALREFTPSDEDDDAAVATSKAAAPKDEPLQSRQRSPDPSRGSPLRASVLPPKPPPPVVAPVVLSRAIYEQYVSEYQHSFPPYERLSTLLLAEKATIERGGRGTLALDEIRVLVQRLEGMRRGLEALKAGVVGFHR